MGHLAELKFASHCSAADFYGEWRISKSPKGHPLSDLAGGHIALMTAPIPVALPLAKGAKVRMPG
jgi:hypothetical protein